MNNKKNSSTSNKIKNVLLLAYEKFLKTKATAKTKTNSKTAKKSKNSSLAVSKSETKNLNKTNDKAFELRLNSRYKELKNLYLKLYNNLDAFHALEEKLKVIYNDRPNELKQIDAKREKNPNWYLSNKIIGENIFIDKFAASIKGTMEKLPYLDKLGITYLNCMIDSTKDNSLINFSSISKRTINDLKNLAFACLEKNIIFGVNLSINSTKKTYSFAKKDVEGDKFYQDMYYCLNYDEAKKIDVSLKAKTSSDKFVYSKKIDKYFFSSSNKLQLDLNYNNPHVFNEMIFNMLDLANKGIQAFNLNSLEKLFCTDELLAYTKLHQLLRIFRIITEIVCPGVLLISDTNINSEDAKAYFGTKLKPECHLVNNTALSSSIWHALATYDVRLLKKNISFFNKLKDHQNFINYITTNDKEITWNFNKNDIEQLNINFKQQNSFLQDFYSSKIKGSFASGKVLNSGICGTTASLCGIEKYNGKNSIDLELSIKRNILLHSFIMSIPGIPVINSADEIAALNDYSYEEDPKLKDDVCNMQKVKFNWEETKNINDAKTIQGRIYKSLKKLETIRKTNKAFDSLASIKLKQINDKSVICFFRQTQGIIYLCIFNFSAIAKCIKFSNDFAENLQNHKKEDLSSINLSPFESKFYKLNAKEL